MLGERRISAVLCSTDLDRSQEFYEQKVGLKLSPETIKNHLVFECGDGTTLLIYGRPSPNKADHTQVRFWSSDVAADVRDLDGRGVEFEEYDFADAQDGRPRGDEPRHREVGVVQGSGRQHHRAVPAGIARHATTPRIQSTRMEPWEW